VTTRITQACSVTSGADIYAIQIRCESSSLECSQYCVFTHSIYTTCPLNGGLLCLYESSEEQKNLLPPAGNRCTVTTVRDRLTRSNDNEWVWSQTTGR